MIETISKSSSKILAFLIMAICTGYAFTVLAAPGLGQEGLDISFRALALGVLASGLLVGNKTIVEAVSKYMGNKSGTVS